MAYDFEKALEGITPAQEGAPLPAPAAPKAKYDFEQALGGIVPTQADTAASMFTASFENPDEQAKLRKLSDSMSQYLGETPPPAAIDVKEAERRVRLAEADHATRASPRTQAWLSREENAKIALDDAKTLADIEGVISATPKFLSDFGKSTAAGAAYDLPAGTFRYLSSPFEIVREQIKNVFGVDVGESELRGLANLAKRGGESFTADVEQNAVMSGGRSLGMNLATLPAGVAMRAADVPLWLMTLSSGGLSSLEADKAGLGATRAFLHGTEDAVIEYWTERWGLKALFDTPAFKNAFLKQAGKFAIKEVGGEQVATVFQDFNAWANINPDKTLNEFIAERPEAALDTLIATLIGVGGQVAVVKAAEKLLGPTTEASATEQRADQMTQLFALAAASKLNVRMPKAFAEFFQDVGDDSFVYVEPKVLIDTLTEAGVPAETVQALVAGREDGAVFGQIEIPTAELVTKLTGTGAEEAIIPVLRVGDPNAMTLNEAKDAGTKMAELFQQDAEKVLKDAATKQEFIDSYERVRDQIAEELAGAAPYTKQQRRDNATGLAAMYATWAHKLGVKPEDVMNGWTDAQGVQHKGYKPAFLSNAQYEAKKRGEDLSQPAQAEWNVIQDNIPTRELAEKNAQKTRERWGPGYEVKVAPSQFHENGSFQIETLKLPKQGDLNQTRPADVALLNFRDDPKAPTMSNGDVVLSNPQKIEHSMFASELYEYEVHDNETGEPLGIVILAMRDGLPTMLANIEATTQRQGMGERVVRALAAMPHLESEGLYIYDIQDKARPFWEKMGVIEEGENNGTLWFDEYRSTRGDGKNPRGQQRTGEEARTAAARDARGNQGDNAQAAGTASEFDQQGRAAGPATAGDFTGAGVYDLLSKDGWTILTAENPNAKELSAAENAARNEDLKTYLRGRGLNFVEVKGKYGRDENSIAITGVTAREASEIGRLFDQESVLTRHGLVYQDGTVDPSIDLTVHSTPPGDFFTTLPDGTTFTVGLDFRDVAKREKLDDLEKDTELAQAQSTRRPTSKRESENHLGEVPLTVDYSKIEPEKTAQNMALVMKYPGLRFKARKPELRVEEFIRHVTDNLLWLHDLIPPAVRERSRQWYDGARTITERWSKKYGKSDAQIAAVIAVFSPQKDWFQNMSLAERALDIVRDQQNTPWSEKMTAVAGDILADEKFEVLRGAIQGKRLSELKDKLEQAAWIRVYDQAHNDRGHRIVTPEGGFVEFATKLDGSKVMTAWPGFQTVVKALYVMENGAPEVIDSALGGEHKVRSFYNNIINPDSSYGFTTIDTHAVAAGLLRPLSGNSIEVTQNFGGAGTATSAKTGMSGTYAYYQEAYRRAAEARGLLPREMQSITWEAVRELYTDTFKHNKAKLQQLDNLWTEYEKGKRDIDSVRAEILKLAGGVEQPSWVGHDPGLSEGGWASSYTGELLERGVSGRGAESAPGGTRTGPARGTQELDQGQRPGAVRGPVVGVHFSPQPRTGFLVGSLYGSGLKGAERERIMSADDRRLRNRVHFYVSNGTGVHPEAGVGGEAHISTLQNLYDADADELKIWRNNKSENAKESALLDAGFGGYLSRDNMTNQGTVVWFGDIATEHVGGIEEANQRADVPPVAEIPEAKRLAIMLSKDKTMPGGAMLASEWKALFEKTHPELAAKVDWNALDQNAYLYKDEVARGLWQQAAPGFYSQLARAFDGAKQESLPADQWASWLKSNAAKLQVKAEEIQWTGIVEWLELRGKAKTSKAEIGEFLRANGVQVQEVVKREGGLKWFVRERGGDVVGRDFNTYEEADDWANEQGYTPDDVVIRENDEDSGDAKFSGYIPPGGIRSAYREILLTLPGEPAQRDMIRMMIQSIEEPALREQRGLTEKELADVSRLREKLAAIPQNKVKSASFSSSHWSEPNVLAHLRIDEVIDADGKRRLRVIEIQSDWGQEGKKEGFDKGRTTMPLAPGEFSAAIERWQEIAAQKWVDSGVLSKEQAMSAVKALPYADVAEMAGATEERIELDARNNDDVNARQGIGVRVPSAPFVTDTKSWVALAMKRVIRYAAENGYDGVVLATGQQNADLYKLSNKVKEVSWRKYHGDKRSTVELLNGDQLTFHLTPDGIVDHVDGTETTRYNGKGFDEVVGKDLAAKIVEENEGRLSGEGLNIGGEGMRAFYDQIVPQVANDVLKKLGGGKVGSVGVLRPLSSDIDPNWGTPKFDPDKWNMNDEGEVVAPQPGFDITPELRALAMKGLPLFATGQQTVRKGAFDVVDLDVAFLADADLSTFTHEITHFYLTVLADMASQPGAPDAIVSDMKAILDHFGIADLATWNAMSLNEQRPYHEMMAEYHEYYVLKGEAPSERLRDVFRRLTEYMKQVYRTVKDFLASHPAVKPNPEMDAIMQRMYAVEEEIAAMEEQRNYVALFKSQADSGMNAEQWAAYQALSPEARQEAEDMLRSRSMRDLKWVQNLRNRKIAEIQKSAREMRKSVEDEVRKEVEQQPIYRAMRWLQLGETIDDEGNATEDPQAQKLSIVALEESPVFDNYDWRQLGTGKRGMLATEGVHPDVVAEAFGFASGESLVRALIETPKLRDAVEAETNTRMLTQHSELSNPDEIARAADEAIHNTVRTRMVATELWALNKNVGSVSALMKAGKEFAKAMLGNKTSKNLKPWVFAAEEVRAGKAAAAALKKGDREEAARQKRTELVNHIAAKEAYAAQREMEKLTSRMKKIAAYKDDDSAVKTRDNDVVNAVRAILSDYGIGKKGERAHAYLEVVKRQNPDLGAVLEEIVNETTINAKDYAKLTLNELRDLAENVESVWYLAKRTRQIAVDGKVMDRAVVQQELYDRLAEIGIPDRVPGEGSAVTPGEEFLMKVGTFKGMLRRVESWAGAKDGKPMGPFRKYIWSQIRDAADTYRTEKVRVLRAYRALLDGVAPGIKQGTIDAPELGYVFGKDNGGQAKTEILHALLHTGNDSNKRKLLLGRGWATDNGDGTINTTQWDGFLARMVKQGVITKADFDFAQGVWDLLEELKPAAQKAHREVFGRYFDEVTANSFVDPFGVQRRGGYVPAMTDSRIVKDAELRELAEQENEAMKFAFPTTARGFTKSRVETYTKPLKLDLRSLSQHIDKVLLFSHLTQPVSDVRRILMSPQVGQALSRVDPAAVPSVLLPWLNRTAKQIVETKRTDAGTLGRFWSVLRARSGMAAMMLNVANAAQQLTGFSLAAIKVKPKYLLTALGEYVVSPRGFADKVAAASPYMQTRLENEVAVMSDHIDEILLNPNVYEKAKNWTNRHAYFLQTAVDSVMSPVIWTGAFNQAIENGSTELEARRLADAAVRETQGAQGPEDIAAFEVGSPFYRMFTQFAGYFNMNANLLGTEFVKVARDMGLRKGYGRGLYVLTLGFLAPAIVGELIIQAFRGGPADDDEDGEYLDDWLAALFGYAPLRYATAMVPVAGQSVMAVANAMNNKPYDDRISTAPAVSMIESGARGAASIYKSVADSDREMKVGRTVRDIGTLISMSVGVPASSVAKPAGYVASVLSGEVQPTGTFDAVRGTITGAASPASKQ